VARDSTDPTPELHGGTPGVDSTPDEDAVGEGTDGVVSPRDEPIAVEGFGTTTEETREGEPLSGRLAREVPDQGVDLPYPEDDWVGQLVADDEGVREDTEKDSVAHARGGDGGQSAEEAAMHIEGT
jgi:hypothetical protein